MARKSILGLLALAPFLATLGACAGGAADGTSAGNPITQPAEITISALSSAPANLSNAPIHIGGRVITQTSGGATNYVHQWPGTYFETAFIGQNAFFRVGTNDEIIAVTIDGTKQIRLTRPAAGTYAINGLSAGAHRVQINVVTESQSVAHVFGGFQLGANTTGTSVSDRPYKIEFIGDSHTVGYGNISTSRDCTSEQVWATTDNSVAFSPIVAATFNADYRVTAISGRGIVRNYNGTIADTMPTAYQYQLQNHETPYANSGWQPQLVVLSLGTNDFSTPLNPGEPWATRTDEQNAYRQGFVQFVRDLRRNYPNTYFVIWAINGNTEIFQQAQGAYNDIVASGESKIGFIPVNGLEMTGCHFHPSAKDDQTIAQAITDYVRAHPQIIPN